MAKFNDVIIAIAKSVAEAEAQLEETQLTNLYKYFKTKSKRKDNNNKKRKENGVNDNLPGIFPVRLKIGVPDENNKYGNKYYCVPYINLIPISQLNIDSITASFDISIIELLEPTKSDNKTTLHNIYKGDRIDNMMDFNNSSDMSIDVKNSAINKDKGTNININISIKKTDNSEGMSKLINEITNSSQGFITVNYEKNSRKKDDNKNI